MILCLISCNENPKGDHDKICDNKVFSIKDTLVFDLAEWVNMPDLGKTRFHKNLFDGPALSFYLPKNSNSKLDKVIILDFKTHKLLHEIEMKNVLTKKYSSINECLIANKDSIFVLHSHWNELGELINEISLIDFKGELLRNYAIPLKRNNGYNYHIRSYSGISLYKKGNSILSMQTLSNADYVTNPRDQNLYFSSPADVWLQLSDDTCIIEKEIGRYPEQYLKGEYFMPQTSEFFREVNDHEQIMYSFFVDDSIHLYSLDGKKTDSYIAKSAWFDFKATQAFNPDSIRNRSYLLKYWMEETRYGRIVYDNYRKLYYRFVEHSLPYVREDGMLNLATDKTFSLIILDKNFKQLSEVCFPGGKYYWNLYVVPEG